MKKNFLISTGGSGGHVIPAIILYHHLSEEVNIVISTDKRGLKYIDRDITNIDIIDTPRLNNIFLLPINFFVIIFLIFKSFLILKTKKIEKIFSTGGYMSLPLIFAAKLLNLDIYLIEPNQVLGRTNKFFLNSCKKIFCYSDKIKNFPENFKSKIIKIYPLVKKDIYKVKKEFKKEEKINILIVGGSQGANIFDKNLKNSIVNISKKNSIKVIHQTSQNNISYLRDFYSNNNIENKIFSFEKNFLRIISEADLCITRAGASTLAELSILNIPFIAVPLPTSRDNHQFENANFYEKNDCCWLIEQNYFEEKIEQTLISIFEKKNDYIKKKENLKKLNNENTWANVNKKILESLNEN
tara:strand:- start:159 stop:1223 length:1065 start_codon:yes stop_codon:yes gene_type:complete